MPWIEGSEGTASRYREPVYGDPEDDDIDFVLALKKQHTKDRELFLTFQRDAEKSKDFNLARFMREQAAIEQKFYRACCFVLSKIMAHPPGDCRVVEMSKELAQHADFIFAKMDDAQAERTTAKRSVAA
jgi:hypothetical protein